MINENFNYLPSHLLLNFIHFLFSIFICPYFSWGKKHRRSVAVSCPNSGIEISQKGLLLQYSENCDDQ